jgi:uncharacterized membrane protein YeaQ/YmgE (transglycosylase-associated protein family)
MGIIWTIIIGFIAGVIAKFIMPGPNEPQGFILTAILGIVGYFSHITAMGLSLASAQPSAICLTEAVGCCRSAELAGGNLGNLLQRALCTDFGVARLAIPADAHPYPDRCSSCDWPFMCDRCLSWVNLVVLPVRR